MGLSREIIDAFLLANGGGPIVCAACGTRSALYALEPGPASVFHEEDAFVPLDDPDTDRVNFYCLPCMAPLIQIWLDKGDDIEYQ